MQTSVGWTTLFRYAKVFITEKSVRTDSVRGHKMYKNVNRGKNSIKEQV